MKKFYIFDMDGTLASSMRYWRGAATVEDWENEDVWEQIFQRMKNHYRNDVELKDGVSDFLKKAQKAGIRMCIASATRKDVAEPFLKRSGVMDFMEFYIDCHEIGVYKDRPDIFLLAAERFGADISECVVFEDSPQAAKAAKQAGFYVVGVFDPITVNDGNIKPYIDDYIEDWQNYKIKA